jgi:beta-fructofuranosidase
MGGDGRLGIGVAAQVAQLRRQEQAVHVTANEEQNQRQIGALRIAGCAGEIRCIARRSARPFELTLRGAEDTLLSVKYDPLHPGQVLVDGAPLPLALGAREDLGLRLYIDGSVIELFVNGQIACTKRFYVPGSGESAVRLQWAGDTTSIASLSVWQLAPISADRLTS